MFSWGSGFLYGVGLAVVYWFFFIKRVDDNYYKRKAKILGKRIAKLANKENKQNEKKSE